MLDFAVDCKNYIPNVVVTIVDIIGEDEINACKKVCEEYNLNLRIVVMKQIKNSICKLKCTRMIKNGSE